MALLCAGSLLVARGVSGAIHECLKGANVPAERVLSVKKKRDFMSFTQYIEFKRVRKTTKRNY